MGGNFRGRLTDEPLSPGLLATRRVPSKKAGSPPAGWDTATSTRVLGACPLPGHPAGAETGSASFKKGFLSLWPHGRVRAPAATCLT